MVFWCEKRRLITVFRLVFVVDFMHSIYRVWLWIKSRAVSFSYALPYHRLASCNLSCIVGWSTCRLSMSCFSVFGRSSVFVILLLVTFVASPIGRILWDWLRKSPRYRTLKMYY